MKLGQTSVVHFLAHVSTSVFGFLATIYFARTFPPALLGTYFVLVAVLGWLRVVGLLGINSAITKRLSERESPGSLLTAGIILQTVVYVLVGVVLVIGKPFVDDYLGFKGTLYLFPLLFIVLAFATVVATLDSEKKVHISALLKPLDRLLRSSFQVALVFLGYELFGMIAGYVAAGLIAVAAGMKYTSTPLRLPQREDFERLLSYVRYSWLSSLSSRSIDAMDTVILAFFVSKGLISVYVIAWNLATILSIFGNSISRSMFPELSELSTANEMEETKSLIGEALAYTGLFLIPGLVGGFLIGERLLGIYGPAYVKGATILVLLILARLIYAYGAQCLSTLNAIDRPDLAFRVQVVFLLSNISLNVLLIWKYGWIGAALATGVSSGITAVLGFYALQSVLDVGFPRTEVAKQFLAAAIMGAFVLVAKQVVPSTAVGTVFVVGIAAAVYGIALFGLSQRIRLAVKENSPI